jgi:hypothetical protein
MTRNRCKRELAPDAAVRWQNHKTLPRKEITTALTVDGAATRRGLR